MVDPVTITIDTNTATGIVLIITAVGSVIVQTIQAIAAHKNRKKLNRAREVWSDNERRILRSLIKERGADLTDIKR